MVVIVPMEGAIFGADHRNKWGMRHNGSMAYYLISYFFIIKIFLYFAKRCKFCNPLQPKHFIKYVSSVISRHAYFSDQI